MEGWQKILVAAGSAAGLAAVVYYLFRDGDVELVEEGEKKAGASSGASGGEITLEVVKEILQEMVGSQQSMKVNMKVLAKKMAAENLTFEQICAEVQDSQPMDPLEKRGLSMADLEGPIQKHQNDPAIMQSMAALMGQDPSSMMTRPSDKSKPITTEKITEINAFMLQELQQFVKNFQSSPSKGTYDIKTVVTATQAMLDSKVTAKFNVETEDMERAIMANQQKLAQDQAFLANQMQIRQTMEQLMQSI